VANFDAPAKVPTLGAPAPVAEAEGISLALPSRFFYYGFKDLYVKPFRALHLAKLSKAHEDRSVLPLVEAVSSVLRTTEPTPVPVGFMLSVADFYYVLYWLKLHSYTKSVLLNTTFCLDPKHLQAVEEKRMSEDSLKIVTRITKNELQITELEEVPNPEYFKMGAPYFLRPATMQDTLEFLEHPNYLDAEFQFLAKLASNFNSSEHYLKLDERIKLVEEFDGDTVLMLQKYEQAVDKFGVVETIKVKCPGCGAEREAQLTLDAHSFLSIAGQD
jgi:hypothetical protein